MLNKIKINNKTREVKKYNDILGILGENKFETLKFTFDEFVDGIGTLALEKLDTEGNLKKYFIELEKGEECYLLEVKNSLLDVAGTITMQLIVRKEDHVVFKSLDFQMTVLNAIEATEEIPDEYETWDAILAEKILEINKKMEDLSKLESTLNILLSDANLKKENIEELREETIKLKKQMPYSIVQGESINVQDATEWDENKLAVMGNLKQETREGYNTFNIDNITEQTLLYYSSGTTASSTVTNISDYIPVKANKSYLLTYNYSKLANTTNRAFCLYNTEKTFVSGEQYDVTTKKVLITPTEDGYIRFSYDINCTNIQLIEGTEEKPYEQYGATPSLNIPSMPIVATGIQRIKKYRKNKLKLSDAETEFAGVTIKIQDNKLILNGTATSGGFKVITSEIKTLLKGTYTFSQKILSGSFNTGAYRLCLKNEDVTDAIKSPLTFTSGVGFATNTVDTNITELGIYINKGNVYNNYTIGLQVEEGNLTDYEPYTEENYELDLGETELCKLAEDSIDKAVFKDDKWQWQKVIKKIVLNGTENWNIDTKQSGCNYYSFFINSYAIPTPMEYSKVVTNLLEEDSTVLTTDNIGICVNWAGAIRLKNGISTTVEELKAWLAENNITAYYVLKTPEYIDCTEEQSAVLDKLYNNLELSKGVNYIEVDIDNVVDEKEDLLKGVTWTQGQISTTDGKTIVSSSTRYHTPLIEIEKEKYIFSKSIERLFLYDENENMLLYKDNANECNVENIDAKYVRVVALAANYQDVAMFKGNADNGVGVNMELTYMQNITLKHDNDIAELKQAIVALGGAI